MARPGFASTVPLLAGLLALVAHSVSGRALPVYGGFTRSLLAVNTTAVSAALTDVAAGDALSLADLFGTLALKNDTETLTEALTEIFYAGQPNNQYPNLTAQATHIANVRNAATIYALSTAYSNAFVALLQNGTTEAIGRATNAISEILLAKQPAFATAAFYAAFLNGLDAGAGQVAALIIVDEFGTCNVGTFLPAQYSKAVQELIEAGNGTAAGSAVAAAALQGCCIAGAVNNALLQEILIQPMGCQNPAVNATFITANDLTRDATGDPAALITALGKFGASSTVLACLEELTVERIIQGTSPSAVQLQVDGRTAINETYSNLLAGNYAAAGAAITKYIATPGSAAQNATQQTVTAVAAVYGCQVVLPAIQVALAANSTAFYQTFGSVMLINECLAQLTQAMGPGGAMPAPVSQGTPIYTATTAAPTTTPAPTTKAPTTAAPTTAAPTTTKAPTPAPTTTSAPTTAKATTAAPTTAAPTTAAPTTTTAAPTTAAKTVASLLTTSATVAATSTPSSNAININTQAQANSVANSAGSGSNGAGAVSNSNAQAVTNANIGVTGK